MTIINIETYIKQRSSRRRAAYEAHLRNLHRKAAAHASSTLEESGLKDLIPEESDYALLVCFEMLRQLSHETCNVFSRIPDLLQIIDEEVSELCQNENENGPEFRSASEIKAFRESKNEQLDFFDIARFTMFAMKADMGPYEQGVLDVDSAVH